MKKLFENNSNANSIWWNKTREAILVGLFDKNDILIKKLKISAFDYIIVPPNVIVKLFS